MLSQETIQKLRDEVHRLKDAQHMFFETYKHLCVQLGGDEWTKRRFEPVFHLVRKEILPIMEQAGMDEPAIQTLCTSAEHVLLRS
jgi:hypothetical protein